MLLYEFVVFGPPVSQQARRRERLRDWKATVRTAAEQYWPPGRQLLDGALSVVIYYFDSGAAADLDNVVKPIYDAMRSTTR